MELSVVGSGTGGGEVDLTGVTAVSHEGKPVVIAADSTGRLWYSVRRQGFEARSDDLHSSGPWDDLRPLPLPGSDGPEPIDQSVLDWEVEYLTAQVAQTGSASAALQRSRFDTHDAGASSGPRVVSHQGVLFVFRQAAVPAATETDPEVTPRSILVDRFVLDGMRNRMVRWLDVRFKRSGLRHEPIADGDALVDALDHRDADGRPFYEPTIELSFLGSDIAVDGWDVELVQTSDPERCRWHFAWASMSGELHEASVASTADRLFDMRDANGPNGIATTKFSLPRGRHAAAPVRLAQFDKQIPDPSDERGERLIRSTTHLMLTASLTTNSGLARGSVALEADLALDGTLISDAMLPATSTALRADVHEQTLPVDAISGIRAVRAAQPTVRDSITSLAAAARSTTRIETDGSSISPGDTVELRDAAKIDGVYPVRSMALGALNRNMGRGNTHIEVRTPLTDAMPAGLRLQLTRDGTVLGEVTTRTRRTGSQPGDVRIGIETADFAAPRHSKVTCLDAFEVASPGSLGTARALPDPDALMSHDGAISRVDQLEDGSFRLHAAGHGLADGEMVRLNDLPVLDGHVGVDVDDGHLVVGRRWPDARFSDLSRRAGLMLPDGARATFPIPGDIGRPARQSTVEMWVRADAQTIVADCAAFTLYVDHVGWLRLGVAGASLIRVQRRVDDGQWRHMAIVHESSGTCHLYLDGVLQSSRETSNDATSSALVVGGGTPRASLEMSELRAWDRALDADEIAESMYAVLNGRELGLAGMWHLGAIVEGEPRVLRDMSAAGRHGTCSERAHIADPPISATAGGAPAERFENEDLVPVVGGAEHEEIVEIKAVAGGVEVGADGLGAILTPMLWGRRSATDDTELGHGLFTVHSTTFAPADAGWVRVTTRYAPPVDARLVRTFGLAIASASGLDSIQVRRLRLRRVAGSVSRSERVASIAIDGPADGEALRTLRSALRDAEEAEATSIDALRRALARQAVVDAGTLGSVTAKARADEADAIADVAAAQVALAAEERDALNYWTAFGVSARILSLSSTNAVDVGWSVGTSPMSHGSRPLDAASDWAWEYWMFDRDTGRIFSAHPDARHPAGMVLAMNADGEPVISPTLDSDDQRWNLKSSFADNSPAAKMWEQFQLQNRGTGRWLSIAPRMFPGGQIRWVVTDDGPTTFGVTRWKDSSRPRIETQRQSRFSRIPAAQKVLDDARTDLAEATRKREELELHDEDQIGQAKKDVTASRKLVEQIRAEYASTSAASGGDADGVEIASGLRAWPLPAVSPTASSHLTDASDGRVTLTYRDADVGTAHAVYGAVAGAPDFGRWRSDRDRRCLDLSARSRLSLTPGVGGPGIDTTVEMWLHLPWGSNAANLDDVDHAGGDRVLATSGDGSIVARSTDGMQWKFGIVVDGTFMPAGGVPDAAGWHHLAVVATGEGALSTTRFFVDGRLLNDVRSVAEAGGTAAAATTFRLVEPISTVGTSESGSLPLGKLAEVRVWNVGLTEEEVAANGRTMATGTEPGLVHALPLDGDVASLTGTAVELTGPGAATTAVPSTARPRNGAGGVPGAVAAIEYASSLVDAATDRRSSMVRRAEIVVVRSSPQPSANGRVAAFSHQRVEELERRWIGTTQMAPTLLGYIEGAPPVPSENLTMQLTHPSYNDASSVQLNIATEVEMSWQRELGVSTGLAGSFFLGVDASGSIGPVDASFKAGVTGSDDTSLSYVNSSSVGALAGDTTSDRLGLRGAVETEAAFADLGKRFVPKNVGYALVVSGVADVFILRLPSTGTMIAYDVVPSAEVPRQINTVTFALNPAYTYAGSLDGLVGTNPADARMHRHVPELRSQFGASYPASYLRTAEAAELEAAIDRRDKERRAFFANFNSRDPGLPLPISDIDGARVPSETDDIEEEDVKGLTAQRQNQMMANRSSDEAFSDAVRGIDQWKLRMRQLAAKAGRQNIVNTYVWDADGGLRTERQTFGETSRLSLGNAFNRSDAYGIEVSAAFIVGAALTKQATTNVSQVLMKTEETRRAVSLDVDVSGLESGGITDADDRPFLPGEKVDRYRFSSFYLAASSDNFTDFFDHVVDPVWLRGNDEEARVLRTIDASSKNESWRVLHRVTHVERPALGGFGRDVRSLAGSAPETTVSIEDLQDQLTELDRKLASLRRAVDQIDGSP